MFSKILVKTLSHSYIIETGICYLALCEQAYPARLAFSYLENLHQEFSEQHGQEIHRAKRPYHFIEFGELHKYKEVVSGGEREREVRNP